MAVLTKVFLLMFASLISVSSLAQLSPDKVDLLSTLQQQDGEEFKETLKQLHGTNEFEVINEILKVMTFEAERALKANDFIQDNLNLERLKALQNVLLDIPNGRDFKEHPDRHREVSTTEELVLKVDTLEKVIETIYKADEAKQEASKQPSPFGGAGGFSPKSPLERKVLTKWNIEFEEIRELLSSYRNGLPTLSERGINMEKESRNPQPKQWRALVETQLNPSALAELFSLEVEGVEKRLEQRIIEQPEVTRYLTDLEKRNKRFPRQTEQNRAGKPEVFLTIGLPGTGKDTTAEEYVDAIHQRQGAYEKHLFRVPLVNNSFTRSALMGSGPGYANSNSFPSILDFLIFHSGGRYQKIEIPSPSGQSSYKVVENPEWKPGQVLPGYEAPDKGVVFINELQNWSYEAVGSILKEFLERGIFRISNPNGGLTYIQVPITIQVASNHGIHLLANRNPDGTRFGEPATYEEMMENWRRNHDNRSLLKKAMGMILGGKARAQGSDAPGIPEEVLNRMDASKIFLLRPLSPAALQKITDIKMQSLRKELRNAKDTGPIRLEWTPELLKFVQEYYYVAEDMARPMTENINLLIRRALDKALDDGLLRYSKSGHDVKIDIRSNLDGTSSLAVRYSSNRGPKTSFLPIEATESQRNQEAIDPEIRQKLLTLEDRLNNKVFGVSKVTREVARAFLVDEGTERTSARVFAFFGISSVGKSFLTQTLTKELANIYGSYGELTIDMGRINTAQDIAKAFSGISAEEHSQFMKAFDRYNGRLVVTLNELPNANSAVYQLLYSYLRDSVVNSFSDGVDRKMREVIFIIDGNVGEEWFKGIPSTVSPRERMLSMQRIYEESLNDRDRVRGLMEKYFPEALINRIDQIFFFPPLSFQSLRELIQDKFLRMIEKMKAGQRSGQNRQTQGWELQFKSRTDYVRVLETLETYGFQVDRQGASIDKFIGNSLRTNLIYELERAGVPTGETILLSVDHERTERNADQVEMRVPGKTSEVYFRLERLNGQTVNVTVPASAPERHAGERKIDQVITAYHEAGHEIVRQVFFADSARTLGVSILPGVTWTGDRWLHYLGIARWEELVRVPHTKEKILRMMAISFGGELAQQLTTGRNDAGMSNDMQKASDLARRALLVLGLSQHLNGQVAGAQQSPQEFMDSLTAEKRAAVQTEVDLWMQEARELARKALILNLESGLIPLGKELSRQGDMSGAEVREFYQQHRIITEIDQQGRHNSKFERLAAKAKIPSKYQTEKGWLTRLFGGNSTRVSQGRDAQLIHKDLMPSKVAMIDEIIEDIRQEQIREARSFDFPLYDQSHARSAAPTRCQASITPFLGL